MPSDPVSLPLVVVHADESCLGNQFRGRRRPGGAAALLESWRADRWARRDLWVSEPSTTNNRMALRSAIVPLAALRTSCRVRFSSDSQYLVKGGREWLPSWKRRGWTRKRGRIENLDLWRRLDEELARHSVEWIWVKGHAGDPRNEYADHLAQRAAREQSEQLHRRSSGFEAWLEDQRRRRDLYLDYFEHAPP